MIGVLLAAEDPGAEGYPETLGATAIVVLVYVFMSFYTHMLGNRLSRREPLSARLMWQGWLHELPIAEGALIPISVLLISWAAGASVSTGVSAALWTSAVWVVVLEVVAGWRVSLRPLQLWLQVGAGLVIGAAILALKFMLH